MATRIQPGTCRYCGCTELRACRVNVGGVITGCWWVDRAQTVCSAVACVMQHQAQRLRAEKAAA